MSGYFDVDRVPFDGRPLSAPVASKARRRGAPRGKHAAGCSSNPEIGCVCDYDPGDDPAVYRRDGQR